MGRIINKLKYILLPKSLKKRWSYDDYLYFRMQYMNINTIREFLTNAELWEAEKVLNDDNYRGIFNSKRRFYERFRKYMKREIVFLADISEEEFITFIKKHGKIVVKPDDMYAGLGFNVIEVSDDGTIIYGEGCLSFQEMKANNYLAEEYVNQAKEYMDVYNLSLNTLRITTFVDSTGKPEILFIVNQFGSEGSIIDNDDQAAIWYIVDKSTGKIIQSEVDENNGFIYDIHPDTGVNMLDFENPVFDKVKKIALEAAMEIPQCRLIGWDIAVRDNYDIEIIEGNVTPELYLYQFITGDGLARINR